MTPAMDLRNQMQSLTSKVKGWSWCEVGRVVGVRRVTPVTPGEATSGKVSFFFFDCFKKRFIAGCGDTYL